MKNRIIYLVRHGITASNKKKIYMGQSDEGLDEEGVKQANILGMRLKGEGISKIYTSPVKRALQTAEILNNYLLTGVLLEEDLREMGIGQWEGMPEEEVKSKYPEEWAIWNECPKDLTLPGREALSSVQERAVKTVNKILCADSSRKIVVVTHVAIIRCLILYSKKLDLNLYKKINVRNAKVFELAVNGYSI
jgi:broad specificity phosphatase PhoE